MNPTKTYHSGSPLARPMHPSNSQQTKREPLIRSLPTLSLNSIPLSRRPVSALSQIPSTLAGSHQHARSHSAISTSPNHTNFNRRSFLRPESVSFYGNIPSSARSATFIEVDLDPKPILAHATPLKSNGTVGENASIFEYPDSTFSISTHSVCNPIDIPIDQSRHNSCDYPNSGDDCHFNSFDVKLQFLVTLAEALIKFGSPGYRMEYLLLLASQTLKVPLTVSVLPNLILMRVAKETVILTVKQGYDLSKLFQVNLLCKALAAKNLAIEQAAEDLEDLIDSPATWNNLAYILACAGCSAFISPLLFNGSIGDAVLSFLLGLIVALMDVVANKIEAFRYVYEFTTATIVSLLATLLKLGLESSCKPTLFGNATHLCYTGVTLSTLYIILPGLSLATSFIELYSLNVISGSVRLAVGLVKMLSLAFGITLGSRLALNAVDSWYPQDVAQCFREHLFYPCPTADAVVSMKYRIWAITPMCVALALCQCVHLRACPQQFGICIGAVFLAFWSFEGLSYLQIGHELAAATTAFAVGIFGNIYSRITRNPGIAPILSGILLLVPGGLAVQSSMSLMMNTSSNAISNTSDHILVVQMILVSLSVALGVLFARIVPPLETQLKTSRIMELRKKLASSSSQQAKRRLVPTWKENCPWMSVLRFPFTPTRCETAESVFDEEGGHCLDEMKKNNNNKAIPPPPGDSDAAVGRYHQKVRLWLRRWDWQDKRGRTARREKAKVRKWLYRYQRSLAKPAAEKVHE